MKIMKLLENIFIIYKKFTSIDLKLREKYVDNYQLIINKDVNKDFGKMILSIVTHDFYYGDK